MSTVTPIAPPTTPETVAELIAQLGDVPPERIRLVPAPGTATEEDLLFYLERREVPCELVDGTLVEKPMGWNEADIAGEILFQLKLFLRENGLAGKVIPGDGPHRMATGRVRLPDVSFTIAENVPPADERGPIAGWAPDLAVEVLSASNRSGEMSRKLAEYFAAGVRLVWYVDPPTRTIRVFTSPDDVVELGDDDTLDGGEVLPGFSLSVRTLFDSV